MHAEWSIDDFLARARDLPVLDVRTPAEFASGHIPGAVNLPLFSDQERVEVGTAYKQQGRETAVRLGLERVAPKMTWLADRLLETSASSGGELLIHCWRGGMRSGSVAWLAGTLGIHAATLIGGYKSFRRKVLESFTSQREIRVVAGLTGTGKTAILKALAETGEVVIDLEAHACHKGSAFGDLGESPQPRQEQFENELAMAWMGLDPERPVWIEDESKMIGKCMIPPALWEQKCRARFAVVEIPGPARIENLRDVYDGFPLDQLTPRIEAIRGRLGGDRANKAIAALRAGDPDSACALLLTYYDRAYQKGLAEIPADRVSVHRFDHFNPAAIAADLIRHI
jgi:tRNA 2-selenouridine synthase